MNPSLTKLGPKIATHPTTLIYFEFADGLPQLPLVPRPGLGDHDERPGVLHSFLKAFAMALGDGTKCKTCFGCLRMGSRTLVP